MHYPQAPSGQTRLARRGARSRKPESEAEGRRPELITTTIIIIIIIMIIIIIIMIIVIIIIMIITTTVIIMMRTMINSHNIRYSNVRTASATRDPRQDSADTLQPHAPSPQGGICRSYHHYY